MGMMENKQKNEIINVYKYLFYSVIFLVCIYLSIQNSGNITTKEINIPSTVKSPSMDSLMINAINKGDKKSFERILRKRILIEGDTELFFYSLLMANKHNDWRACKFIFDYLDYEKNKGIRINGIETFSGDKTTETLAIYYLLKSYELGNPDTLKFELNEYFKFKKIPKSNDYLISILK